MKDVIGLLWLVVVVAVITATVVLVKNRVGAPSM